MIRIEAEYVLENKVKFKQHPAMKTGTTASSTDLHSFLYFRLYNQAFSPKTMSFLAHLRYFQFT